MSLDCKAFECLPEHCCSSNSLVVAIGVTSQSCSDGVVVGSDVISTDLESAEFDVFLLEVEQTTRRWHCCR